MPYASLLVHVDVDATTMNPAELAAGLATRLNARLIGLAAAMPFPKVISDGVVVDGHLIEAERKEIEAGLAKAGERFRGLVAADVSRMEWRATIDLPTNALIETARVADLLILGREDPSREKRPYGAVDPADVVMKAGRPMLLVPPGIRILEARRIVIAWKNTREARRAVADALPLLAGAETVLLVAIDEGSDAARADIDDAAVFLRTHNVVARSVVQSCEEKTIADCLVQVAQQENADLIVAGAYGHSRLREWAFGGVTRDLLAHCPVCCLLSH